MSESQGPVIGKYREVKRELKGGSESEREREQKRICFARFAADI